MMVMSPMMTSMMTPMVTPMMTSMMTSMMMARLLNILRWRGSKVITSMMVMMVPSSNIDIHVHHLVEPSINRWEERPRPNGHKGINHYLFHDHIGTTSNHFLHHNARTHCWVHLFHYHCCGWGWDVGSGRRHYHSWGCTAHNGRGLVYSYGAIVTASFNGDYGHAKGYYEKDDQNDGKEGHDSGA